MGKNSGISWTHHTFSPWWGCTPVGEECRHCYAASWARRCGLDCFGAGKPRREFDDRHWREPLKWDAAAARHGVREMVFPSMCDPFDEEVPIECLHRFMGLIEDTPHLDWLLLTKREGIMLDFCAMATCDWPSNAWLGVTAGTQASIDRRVPALLQARQQCPQIPVLFVSVEPMLEAVKVSPYLGFTHEDDCGVEKLDQSLPDSMQLPFHDPWVPGIDWVIAGCESLPGQRAGRPISLDAVRSLRDQCTSAGTPFFLKQLADDGGRLVKMPELDGRVWAEFPRGGQHVYTAV